MNNNPVAWFEIPVNDMNRAKAFFEKVFALELTLADMGDDKLAFFPMTDKAYGTSGALVLRSCLRPSADGTLIYFHTSDIPGTLALAEANGGSILIPRTDIGQHGFFGIMQDTEGNHIGLHSME